MKSVFLLLVVLLLITVSCDLKQDQLVVKPDQILEDPMSFLYYEHEHLRLAEEFTAYDTASKVMVKGEFLKQAASGKYLPLRLVTADSSLAFKLHPLSLPEHEEISGLIRQLVGYHYEHYQMEGKPIAPYTFVDLDGNTYDRETTKGKILVLKCWFIACTACVKEMPELNKLVDRYKSRKDVLFLSLAFDSAEKLLAFQKKKHFQYAVVPDKRKYMSDSLKVKLYPTHFLIDKQGRIAKVVNDAKSLVPALDRLAAISVD